MNSIKYIILFSVLLCFEESNSQNEIKIIDKLINFGKREVFHRDIDVIIIHSVYNTRGGNKYDIDSVIQQFRHYKVSSHYVIGRDGKVFRLVPEKEIAFHAGKSKLPDGRTSVNACSIGIELISSDQPTDKPTNEQILTLSACVNDIQSRYKIKYILRHSDIAPSRKNDPWNMDWNEFLKTVDYK